MLSPATVTIRSGESVMFVNNHNRDHQMSSDPHPNHTDCPAINALATLGSGQSRATNALSTTRTWGVHDHLEDTNNSLKGSIIVQHGLLRTHATWARRDSRRRKPAIMAAGYEDTGSHRGLVPERRRVRWRRGLDARAIPMPSNPNVITISSGGLPHRKS